MIVGWVRMRPEMAGFCTEPTIMADKSGLT
jgi:hypothetical protein